MFVRVSGVFFLGFCVLLGGCASQRQKPVCAEIQYRLDHMAQSPDQRRWLEEELRQCEAEQAEYAKSDSLTNKFSKSIYELYEEARRDSAKTESDSTKAGIRDSLRTATTSGAAP